MQIKSKPRNKKITQENNCFHQYQNHFNLLMKYKTKNK